MVLTETECVLSQNALCHNLCRQPNQKRSQVRFYDRPFSKSFSAAPSQWLQDIFSSKKCLIIDLSPHSASVPSINSFIPLDKIFLKYLDIDQAVELIKIVGRETWLTKIDITSAFKVMLIHPDSCSGYDGSGNTISPSLYPLDENKQNFRHVIKSHLLDLVQ